jgi:hypothetical protein
MKDHDLSQTCTCLDCSSFYSDSFATIFSTYKKLHTVSEWKAEQKMRQSLLFLAVKALASKLIKETLDEQGTSAEYRRKVAKLLYPHRTALVKNSVIPDLFYHPAIRGYCFPRQIPLHLYFTQEGYCSCGLMINTPFKRFQFMQKYAKRRKPFREESTEEADMFEYVLRVCEKKECRELCDIALDIRIQVDRW